MARFFVDFLVALFFLVGCSGVESVDDGGGGNNTGNYDFSDYPSCFIGNDGEFDGKFVVHDSAPAADVIGLVDIASSIGGEYGISIPPAVLSSSVPDPLQHNIITAGHPSYNTTAAAIADYDPVFHILDEDDESAIRIYNHNNHVQIVIAGHTSQDGRVAAYVLAHHQDYNLQSDCIIVTGDVASHQVWGVDDVHDVLEQGEVKSYVVNGSTYEVEVVYIGGVTTTEVKFRVNGEVTKALAEEDTYILADGAEILVRELLDEEAGEITADQVEFYILKKILL